MGSADAQGNGQKRNNMASMIMPKLHLNRFALELKSDVVGRGS